MIIVSWLLLGLCFFAAIAFFATFVWKDVVLHQYERAMTALELFSGSVLLGFLVVILSGGIHAFGG